MKRVVMTFLAVFALTAAAPAQTVTIKGASAFVVSLTWDAPLDSPVAIAGYSVFQALDGTNVFHLLNSSPATATSWTDATVQSGLTYDYLVESVDAAGDQSAPSTPIIQAIPLPPGAPTNLTT